MEAFITNMLDGYGPLAVFILLMMSGLGIPLGEDLIIIPAGALVAEGHMAFWPTLAFAYFGVLFADMLWFGICQHYGTPLLHKRWVKRLLHPRKLLEAKHQFEQRGIWLIVMSRFIPGSRSSAITVAGMLHMPFWSFVAVEAICIAITSPLQLGLGYLIAKNFSSESTADMLLKVLGLIVLILAVMLILNWIRAQRRSKQRPPRAKARWLRRFRERRAIKKAIRTGTAPETSADDHSQSNAA